MKEILDKILNISEEFENEIKSWDERITKVYVCDLSRIQIETNQEDYLRKLKHGKEKYFIGDFKLTFKNHISSRNLKGSTYILVKEREELIKEINAYEKRNNTTDKIVQLIEEHNKECAYKIKLDVVCLESGVGYDVDYQYISVEEKINNDYFRESESDFIKSKYKFSQLNSLFKDLQKFSKELKEQEVNQKDYLFDRVIKETKESFTSVEDIREFIKRLESQI